MAASVPADTQRVFPSTRSHRSDDGPGLGPSVRNRVRPGDGDLVRSGPLICPSPSLDVGFHIPRRIQSSWSPPLEVGELGMHQYPI
jgi:hypothetical protein